MSGLIMPSFLGAGWVWFAQGLVAACSAGFTWDNGIPLGYALVLLLYYMLPYLILVKASTDYSWCVFAINLGDSAVMVFAFYALGLVDTAHPVDYVLLSVSGAALALLAIIYRRQRPKGEGRSVIAQIVLIGAAIAPLFFTGHTLAYRWYLPVVFVIVLFYLVLATRK